MSVERFPPSFVLLGLLSKAPPYSSTPRNDFRIGKREFDVDSLYHKWGSG